MTDPRDVAKRLRRGVRMACNTPAENNAAERLLCQEAADVIDGLADERDRLREVLKRGHADVLLEITNG